MVAFLAGVPRVPVAILQLTGVLRERSKLVGRVPGANQAGVAEDGPHPLPCDR
jgi:hypothetical protein